jgi:DNA-binding Lrp family transcriptional regulator
MPSSSPLGSPLARALINRFQGGFPLCERPFREAAQDLGTDEATLIETVRALLDDGFLTRFGPLYDAERLGGRFTLAAMAVPEGDFDRVARMLGASPEVAHNYRRDHALNMWFVLATPSEAALNAAIRRIQSATGMVVHDFPKLREYHLGFWLDLGVTGPSACAGWSVAAPASPLPSTPRTAP